MLKYIFRTKKVKAAYFEELLNTNHYFEFFFVQLDSIFDVVMLKFQDDGQNG